MYDAELQARSAAVAYTVTIVTTLSHTRYLPMKALQMTLQLQCDSNGLTREPRFIWFVFLRAQRVTFRQQTNR
jgi:hypothetical protein